ncbi:MAG: lysophospholipid acyltransferase family protein [Candidatus Dormibacteria bacterium]
MAEATDFRAPPRLVRAAFDGVASVLHGLGATRYAVADAAGVITYWCQSPAKRRLCAELHARAAGGLPAAEASRRARASYRNYARMIIDTLWIHAVPLSEVMQHGDMDHPEYMDAARDTGSGGILALVHVGSWDAAASFALAAGHPLSSVMAPVGPRWVTDLLAWSRAVKKMELFTPSTAARGLLRALRAGRLVALLVDIPEGGPTVTVRFCNGPVRFSVGPAFLARATGAPIIPVECWRDGRRYRVHLHEPFTVSRDADDGETTQRLATVLEERVRRTPEQWYPFNEIYVDRQGGAAAATELARQ